MVTWNNTLTYRGFNILGGSLQRFKRISVGVGNEILYFVGVARMDL